MILVPLKFFFLFSGFPPEDLYRAGLLTPLSVMIGMICIIFYNESVTTALGEGEGPVYDIQQGENNV